MAQMSHAEEIKSVETDNLSTKLDHFFRQSKPEKMGWACLCWMK